MYASGAILNSFFTDGNKTYFSIAIYPLPEILEELLQGSCKTRLKDGCISS